MIAVTLSLSVFVVSDNSVVRAAEDGIQMYRMYNPTNGEHLHTKDVNERNVLITKGWNYEGVSFIVADSGSPVYRLFNRYSGEHHYTMDANERRSLLIMDGWSDEGIGWYSNKTGDECEIAVYRLFNPWSTDAINSHHYTLDANERDVLVNMFGWNYEGTSWVSMHDVATVDGVEATCVSTGYSGKAVCKTCGKEYVGSTLPINANNHIHTTYHPSESKEINGAYVCKTCGEVFARSISGGDWNFKIDMMNHFNNYHGDNVTERDLHAWTETEWFSHYRNLIDLYPHYTITIPAHYHCEDCGKDIH